MATENVRTVEVETDVLKAIHLWSDLLRDELKQGENDPESLLNAETVTPELHISSCILCDSHIVEY